ncbi:hypothetical protein CQW23_12319 [Capsicum baccatum]|uniref:Ubiquitin-like protease family profile domain-containing protein n=1 Tax=Capsicum baccatum TaxID=33114 RepID=A0A2G2WSE5_CAPBA|nr:hypothetical protein CQW23_12319 [Capsicum baccatum]
MADNHFLLGNPLDVEYIKGIAQQFSGSLDCGVFVAAYIKYLSDGLQISNNELDVELLHNRYATLLWNYKIVKARKGYISDSKDSPRSKSNFISPDEA